MLGIPPLKAGSSRGWTVNLDGLVRSYWKAMGWNADNGMPTDDCIHKLGLDEYL